MEGILKVTPERLEEASGEFKALAGQMSSLTSEMMSLVQSLKTVWQGEASDIYGEKFNSLQTDMDKLYRMVSEHSDDLAQMAEGYAQAESANTEKGGSMKNNIIV